MYARIERFNLSQGFVELAEELADQIAPIMRHQPGMQSLTMLSDETSGEYFFVTYWATLEQIGVYEKSADEWRVRDIMSRHITTVPQIEVYQVHDVPVAVGTGVASAAPVAMVSAPAPTEAALAEAALPEGGAVHAVAGVPSEVEAADAPAEVAEAPADSAATEELSVASSVAALPADVAEAAPNAEAVIITRDVVVEVSDTAVVTTEVVTAALVEPSGGASAASAAPLARSVVRAQEAGVAVVEPVAGACPATHQIKGNHSSSGDFIYHLPGSRFYDRTNPEVCFATEAEAQAAGFRAPRG